MDPNRKTMKTDPISPQTSEADEMPFDDENHDYIVKLGEVWADRFEINSVLGRGSFGQVVKAYDRLKGEMVAIKIIKNKPAFYRQGLLEIDVIKKVNATGSPYIVTLKEHFVHREHLCLVFELLSYNLYDLIQKTKFRGVSLTVVRKVGMQLFKALEVLSRPEVGVIHCDLKPENILLCNPTRSAVKIIDFGSSCAENKTMFTYIQSRFYRSPEVILGLPYSRAIDTWSAACILFELHTGEPLFPGIDELDQLGKMIELLGLPPSEMICVADCEKVLRYFSVSCGEEGLEYEVNVSAKAKAQYETENVVPHAYSLCEVLDSVRCCRSHEEGHTSTDYALFEDLLQRMLTFDPSKRITPTEALNHPFFQKKEVSSMPPPRTSSNTHMHVSPDTFTTREALPRIFVQGPDSCHADLRHEEKENSGSHAANPALSQACGDPSAPVTPVRPPRVLDPCTPVSHSLLSTTDGVAATYSSIGGPLSNLLPSPQRESSILKSNLSTAVNSATHSPVDYFD